MKGKDKFKNEKNYKIKISLKAMNFKYSPSDEIEAILIIQPNKEIKLNNLLENSEFHLIFQEKIEYQYFESGSKTFILDKKLLKFKNKKDIDNRKLLQIPIKYKLPPADTQNFHPSYIYCSESIKCFISHYISVELPFISNKTSINIFIKKMPIDNIYSKTKDKEKHNIIIGDALIKKLYFFNVGIIKYYIKYKKSIGYKDKCPIEIHIYGNEMGENKLESIFIKLKKQLYFYNELNTFTDAIKEEYDIKHLIVNKNQKNKTYIIFENLKLPKTEFIPISSIDIDKINLSKNNLNFTPPVNNCFFKCDYNIEISFSFDDKLISDIIINIPIDFYDSESIIFFNNNLNKNRIIEKNKNENDKCMDFTDITNKGDIMNIKDGEI